MKLAVLFAGQGSQAVGMGRDFYDKYAEFREIFDKLSEEERNIAWYGPKEVLSDTQNTQPILLAFGLGVFEVLKANGVSFAMGAGLSLGEYTALAAAGVWKSEEAIDIVRYRAAQMKEAAKGIEAEMYAVMGLSKEETEECCKEAGSQTGFVGITNLNCPGQVVISGEKNAAQKAVELALSKGAKRAMKIEVSGPFHTPYMESAGEALAKRFSEIKMEKETFPIFFNCLGRGRERGEEVSELLVKQVSSGVLMEDIIRKILEEKPDAIVEIGPGKVLAGFVKKIDRNVECISISEVEDLEKLIADFAEN